MAQDAERERGVRDAAARSRRRRLYAAAPRSSRVLAGWFNCTTQARVCRVDFKRRILLVTVASLVMLPVAISPAIAQVFSVPQERFFRLDWRRERQGERDVAIAGYVYNDYSYPVRRVQLQIQVFDAAGEVKSEVFGWVLGDVQPSGRGYFRISLPVSGSAYGVTVYSFEFGPRESP